MDRTTALLYVGSAIVVLLVIQYVLKAVTQPTAVIVVERPYRGGGGGLPGWGPRTYVPPSHPTHPSSAPPPPPPPPAAPSQPATPPA